MLGDRQSSATLRYSNTHISALYTAIDAVICATRCYVSGNHLCTAFVQLELFEMERFISLQASRWSFLSGTKYVSEMLKHLSRGSSKCPEINAILEYLYYISNKLICQMLLFQIEGDTCNSSLDTAYETLHVTTDQLPDCNRDVKTI